jgi:hypothetical protein
VQSSGAQASWQACHHQQQAAQQQQVACSSCRSTPLASSSSCGPLSSSSRGWSCRSARARPLQQQQQQWGPQGVAGRRVRASLRLRMCRRQQQWMLGVLQRQGGLALRAGGLQVRTGKTCDCVFSCLCI